ncbi:MAG: hypothetical protein ACKVHU_18635 [Acidimicrobiales bacterium]
MNTNQSVRNLSGLTKNTNIRSAGDLMFFIRDLDADDADSILARWELPI